MNKLKNISCSSHYPRDGYSRFGLPQEVVLASSWPKRFGLFWDLLATFWVAKLLPSFYVGNFAHRRLWASGGNYSVQQKLDPLCFFHPRSISQDDGSHNLGIELLPHFTSCSLEELKLPCTASFYSNQALIQISRCPTVYSNSLYVNGSHTYSKYHIQKRANRST